MTDLVEVLRGRDEHTAQCAADEIERLSGQRDELLAALKRASESLGRFVSDEGWGKSDMDCMDNADAIIAKVEADNA